MWKEEYNEKLIAICGKKAVLTGESSRLGYSTDALTFTEALPDCVVIPQNNEQLKQVLACANESDFPYVLRGAGTGLSGGATALQGGLVIHISRLKNILEINTRDHYCVVEPGVVHQRLNDALAEKGFFYPPDPSSGFASTLGGNIAENAGGIRCFKYGVAAQYLLGVEIMTLEGELIRLGGPAGGLGAEGSLNWKALLCGSEGMLAAITKIWLRVRPLPSAEHTFLASFKDLRSTTDCIIALAHQPASPVAIEMLDHNCVNLVESSPLAAGLERDSWALLVEINGPQALVDAQVPKIKELFEENNAFSVRDTGDPKERLKLWKARKVAGGITGQVSPDVMVQDAVIPRSKVHEVMERVYKETAARDVPVVTIFHAGDGNLHPNFLFDASVPGELKKVKELGEELMKVVADLGGTLSGEHGIGCDKMHYLPYLMGKREISAQKALLDIFNPDHKLNPGKVFEGRDYK